MPNSVTHSNIRDYNDLMMPEEGKRAVKVITFSVLGIKR